MKKKMYSYKFIVGLLIGLLLVTGVYASNNILSSDVYYDSSNSSIFSGDLQSAIDDVTDKIEDIRPTSCLDGYYCESYKHTLELGDYVYYEPVVESYSTDTTKTNYSVSQTINPSELKLWRVLFINDDGTVDLVSEDVSSTDVYFVGLVGYQNLVGYLNVLASKYETEGITVGSRHFGYNGQTEYITDTSMFTNSAPWTCSTSDTCNSVENQGGGDNLYTKDYNQAQTALKVVSAYKVGTGKPSSYWLASRWYSYSSSSYYYWLVRSISADNLSVGSRMYVYNDSEFTDGSSSGALRPIVTLSSGLFYEGLGTKEYPMRIITG